MSTSCLAFILCHPGIDQLAEQSGNHFLDRQCCKRASSIFYTKRGASPWSRARGCCEWPCSPVGDSSSSPPVATGPIQSLYSPILSPVLHVKHTTRFCRLFISIWTNLSNAHHALGYFVQPYDWSSEPSAWNAIYHVLFGSVLGASGKARPLVLLLPTCTLRIRPTRSPYNSS
jgi:hypothetical protein